MNLKELDWNDGITSKQHIKSGIWINMQKKQPGIFYDMRGGLIPASLAEECGFDVKKLQREAERKMAVNAALDSVEDEFSDADEREVLFKKGDYIVVAAAKGYADIMDIDGNMVSSVKMKRSEAIRIARELTKEIPDEPEPDNPSPVE